MWFSSGEKSRARSGWELIKGINKKREKNRDEEEQEKRIPIEWRDIELE